MNPTLPVSVPPAAPVATIDALVLAGLSAGERAAVEAYAAITHESVLCWAAKLARAS